jgi:uncharacterized membrane protein YozB (DUF420 family)
LEKVICIESGWRLALQFFATHRNPAWFRPIYLVILLTYTVLAIVIVPLILVTLYRAWRQRFDPHKKSPAGRGRCECMFP